MSQIFLPKRVSFIGVMVLTLLSSSSLFSKVEIVNHTDEQSKLAPSGSFESLKFSVKNNIDYDFNVQLSKDGELVLAHDSVSKYTWEKLSKKRIASSSYNGHYANAKYIRLDDVLSYVRDTSSSIKLHLDVKNFNTSSNGPFQKTLDMVHNYGLMDNVYFWVRSISEKNRAKTLRHGNKAHYALWVAYNAKLAVTASKSNNNDGIDMIGFRYKQVYDGGYSLDNITDILHNKNIKITVYGIPQVNSLITNYQNIDYISDSKPEKLLKVSYFKNHRNNEVKKVEKVKRVEKIKKVEQVEKVEQVKKEEIKKVDEVQNIKKEVKVKKELKQEKQVKVEKNININEQAESLANVKIKFEAEDEFIKVHDLGKNKIEVLPNIYANETKFVSIFDRGDSVKFKFFIDESNEFSLGLRVRSGYPTDKSIYFDAKYYTVKIDGHETEYFSDEYSITEKHSNEFYWGVVNTEYQYFNKGEHSVEIEMKPTARVAWGAIDSITVEY